MKTKKIAIILGASLLAMTITGCSDIFKPLFINELESLEITATPSKEFVKGDHIFDCTDIEVSGWFTNGKEKSYSTADVELFYKNSESDEEYSIGTAIPEAGNYSVQARLGNVVSDCYRFTASAEHIYASSFALEEDIEQLTLAPGTSKVINLAVAPTNYTEQIEFVSTDSHVAWVNKIDKTTIEIVAKEEGRASISLGAITSEKLTYQLINIGIIVNPIYVDYMIPMDVPEEVVVKDEFTCGVAVTPGNANVDIECYASNNYVEIIKESPLAFHIITHEVGETYLSFVARKSATQYYSVSRKLIIKDSYVKGLSVTKENTYTRFTHNKLNVYVQAVKAFVTVPIQPYTYDHDIIDVSFEKNNGPQYVFDIYAKKAGETNLVFKAKSGQYTYVTAMTHITVEGVYTSELNISGPKVVNVGSTIILNVDVKPAECIVDVKASMQDSSIASIKKLSDTAYEVKGLKVGETNVFFSVDSPFMFNQIKLYKLRVEKALQKQKIRQTYHDLNFGLPAIYPKASKSKPVYMLVIPIWFTDSYRAIGKQPLYGGADGIIYNLKEKLYVYTGIERAFFGDLGTEMNVQEYFQGISGGAFNTKAAMGGWYEDKYAYTYYEGDDQETNKKRIEMLDRAVEDYFRKHKDVPRADFDRDGDGYIDYAAFVVANTNTLRSFASWTSNKDNNSKQKLGNFAYISYSSVCRGGYELDMPQRSTINHESGHLFGAPDYYNEQKEVNFDGYSNLMGGCAGMLDPFNLMAIGWREPYIIKESTTITIHDIESSGQFILLTPEWNNYDSPFDEYLLLELYSVNSYNSIFDYLFSDAGIRLWHIDARMFDTDCNFTCDANKGRVHVFNNRFTYKDRGLLEECNVAFAQTIRKDTKVNTDEAIPYWTNELLNADQLFYEGDSFNFYDYRNQFWNYYAHKDEYIKANGAPSTDAEKTRMENSLKQYIAFDNDKKFNYSFTVDKIVDNRNGTWSATITFTKTA